MGHGGSAVQLRAATLRFGPRTIWHDLNIDITPGECVAVLGPNGAGKTTLLKVLLGLVALSSGRVTLDGRPPKRGSSEIGYLAQQRAFAPDLPIRGRDLVQFGLDGHRRGLPWGHSRVVDEAIAAVGADTYADAPVGQLSGGEQQRLRIAQTLVGKPRMLLCDEPLLSLDPSSQETVVSMVDRYHQQHGTTVIFVTHEINPVIGFIDRVLYVAGGRWLAGRRDEVMTSERLTALYGSRIDVIRIGERIVVVGESGEGVAGHVH